MFRFTIRDILWLTVIVAFAVCWSTDRRTARRRQRLDEIGAWRTSPQSRNVTALFAASTLNSR